MPDVFHAISDPRRRAILDHLAGGELASGDLAARLPVTPGAVSQHLKVLREAGLVAVRRDGRRRLYRVTPEPLGQVHDWIAHHRAWWEDRLDVLADLVQDAPVDATPGGLTPRGCIGDGLPSDEGAP